MKKIILLLSLIVLIGCKSKKTALETEKKKEIKFEKLALTAVDAGLKNKAYELGKRILMTCNTSKFKPFNETEATSSVIANITLEKLSKTCTRYRQFYGDFKDIQLVEIFKDYQNNNIVFRYKALYTKKVANKELRVYMNEENKISAIKSMDWKDSF
ncbi:hypothetical protein [Flavobacterium granuli]|uniref:Lipoprotein n=1 Tax=Flavobacterium granuli TaxID=280093 RepID=A0A1M5T470_9FLAO|nr:hypothetical protein [Flavobacterium granuli]PRZ20678.1 hypothetical protein BC624_11154 [Flavobacterium granuli]SHH45163.1 hypothetical protein SAMN05443373_11354 [Flavobacterium granuli]